VKLPLKAQIVKPAQRIPRYELLLKVVLLPDFFDVFPVINIVMSVLNNSVHYYPVSEFVGFCYRINVISNWISGFWVTVCKTVCPILSDRCLSLCLSCL